MNPVLVAHGTRKPDGVAMITDLADRVGRLLGRRVHTAFVDVLGPTPADVLSALPAGPAVVVPAFLASGYHVRVDLPTFVAASGHPDVTVTAALGPSADVVRVVTDRLVESGWRPGDSVILAAAGTSDDHAKRDLRITATLLSAAIGDRVELAYAATGEPRVAEAVAAIRSRGAAPRGGRVVPPGRRVVPGPPPRVGGRRGDRTAGHPPGRRAGHREPLPPGAAAHRRLTRPVAPTPPADTTVVA